jgi:asparagine synthase (glutamine-hydrolysing)
MCGIVGFVGEPLDEGSDRNLLTRMCGAIRHRGPDGEGIFYAKNIGLGMRRLSIIDLESGQQPISNEDGTITVVFNGEIYNYQELRQTLAMKGHHFSTESDTETIVHAYEQFGEQCPSHLRGMFAFALWDQRNQRLILARDRMGIKPLYYAVLDNTLFFASEMKALGIVPKIKNRKIISEEAVNAYFTFGYIPDPLTIFDCVQQLPPGNMIIWERGNFRVQQYWNLRPNNSTPRSLQEWKEELLTQLDEAVRLHLVSDVPVGVFLSGGIDSSAVLALMVKHLGKRVKTFSIGFEGNSFYDERFYAKMVADQYETEHHEFVVQPDVRDILPHLIDAFDQPFADSSSIPTYYVSQITSQHVKVALSGLGADELFGGYERYLGAMLSQSYRRIPAIIRDKVLSPFISSIPDSSKGWLLLSRAKRFVKTAGLDDSSRYLGMISFFTHENRNRLLSPDLSKSLNINKPEQEAKEFFQLMNTYPVLTQMLLFDQNYYLPGDLLVLTDRISMAHSLEVRVPFLDHRFLEFAMTVPSNLKINGSKKKYILKEAVTELLPHKILNRGKRGFSVPLAEWIRGELREVIQDCFNDNNLKEVPFLNRKEVQRIVGDHMALRTNYESQIWAILIFVLWYKASVDY